MILPPVGVAGLNIPDEIPVIGMDPCSFQLTGQFLVSREMIEDLERFGPRQKFWDAYLICDALERPTVILEGLKRTNFGNGYCYCSVPNVRWKSETETFKPPPLKVFCVYVNPSDGGLCVLDWDWRIVGPGATGIPYRWERYFERIVWPTS